MKPSKIFQKQIDKLKRSNPNIVPSIYRKVDSISKGLVPKETITGYHGVFKTRVGKYRIAYTLKNDKFLILLMIKKRNDAYKNLSKIFE